MFLFIFSYYKQAKEHRLDFLKKSFNTLWRLDIKFSTNHQYISVGGLWLIFFIFVDITLDYTFIKHFYILCIMDFILIFSFIKYCIKLILVAEFF